MLGDPYKIELRQAQSPAPERLEREPGGQAERLVIHAQLFGRYTGRSAPVGPTFRCPLRARLNPRVPGG